MITIDLAPATEAQINRLLRVHFDGAPTAAYVLMLLASVFKLDLDPIRPSFEKMVPQAEQPHMMANAEQEQIIDDAGRHMMEILIKERDDAIAAIMHKDRLQIEVTNLERQLLYCEREAVDALRNGDRESARARLKDRARAEGRLAKRRTDLAAATEAVNSIKKLRQEESLPKTTSQALDKAFRSVHFSKASVMRTLYQFYLGRVWAVGADESSDARQRTQEKTMRIDLDLPEEAIGAIRAEAERRGLTPEDYIGRVIDGMAHLVDLITPHETVTQNEPHETYQETADDIIIQAMQEMMESQIHCRERAVKVITQKNKLVAQMDRIKVLLVELERKSIEARNGGNRDLALAFYKEKMVQEHTLQQLMPLLAEATEFAEQFKADIRRQEEHIRQRAAEAILLQMSLKTQAYAFRLDRGPMPLDLRDIEADFERWAADYEREQQALNTTFASRSEDVETTLNRLEEMVKQKPDPKDGR